jgi:hypothetical protein
VPATGEAGAIDGLTPIIPKRVERPHLALVAEVRLPGGDLEAVAAAVQRQLVEDVAPIWGVSGTISAFPSLEHVPPTYWPIVVSDRFAFPMLGFHQDLDDRPFALVKHSDSYSQAVSHEAIEMVVDSDGERLVVAAALDGPGRREYLLEVCDPSEAAGYAIDGILVSDFYTPRYFDAEARPGVRYSFTGAVKEPRQVLAGGYLTWQDPDTGASWQYRRFEDDEGIRQLDDLPAGGLQRATVDGITRNQQPQQGLPPSSALMRHAREATEATERASRARAAKLRKLIDELNYDADRSAT